MLVSIGPVALNCEVEGEGKWLVLLHEIGGALATWAKAATALSSAFTVLRYDQRGAGLSDRISGDFTIETQIDDLALLLDKLGATGRCHFAGVAIGAALAARFAIRFPQRAASLVLACPAPGVDPARAKYVAERAALVERDGMGATVENSLANSYPEIVRRDPAAFAAYRAQFLANDPKSYAAINRAFAHFDVAPDLGNIRCPTLVLAGTHDKLRPPEFVRGIAGAIPGAQYREIDSAHVMPVQAPQAMIEEMFKFYREIGVAAKTP